MSISLSIVAGGLGSGVIIAILIGCILLALGCGYIIYKWNLKKNTRVRKDMEDSLIDRDTLNIADQEV